VNKLRTLLLFDVKILRFWLLTRPISKLIVIFGFFTVFAFVDRIIYVGTIGLLSLFKSSGMYGVLTALYMLHAAIIVLAWFAIGSTILTTVGRFLQSSKTINFLVTLPLSPRVIVTWIIAKTFLMQLILLSVFIFPVALGYAHVFATDISLLFLSTTLLVLIITALFTTSIGTLLGYLFIPFFKKSVKKSLAIFGILFLLSGFFIFSLIYPRHINMLDDTQNSTQFQTVFHSLPLGVQINPSYWLADSIISGFDFKIVLFFLFVLFIAWYIIVFLSNKFISLFQNLQEFRLLKESNKEKRIFISSYLQKSLIKTRYPIVIKDFASIIRLPSELGYGIFIFSLTGIFFALLLIISNKISGFTYLQQQIVLFFFSSLMFFAIAFLLRFSFPLFAREGTSAWFIFTQPLSKYKFLQAKLMLSLLLTTPFFILSILVWGFAQFITSPLLLIVQSVITLLTIVCATTIMGGISPNFADSQDAEKISTNGTGLFSLAITVVIVAINEYLLVQMLQQPQLIYYNFYVMEFANIILLLILLWIFTKNSNYQF
jgi:hypothetical protein